MAEEVAGYEEHLKGRSMANLNLLNLKRLLAIAVLMVFAACESNVKVQSRRAPGCEAYPDLEVCRQRNAQARLTFITEAFISNDPQVEIAWEKSPRAVSYRLEIADNPSCDQPLLTFNQFGNSKQMGFIKDGFYYFCVYGIRGDKTEFAGSNNGLKITVDSTAPRLKVDNETIEADEVFSPEFEVADLTELAYNWSSDSLLVRFEDSSAKAPGISFLKPGTYQILLKVSDEALNLKQQYFTIVWTGEPVFDPDNLPPGVALDAEDYDIKFEKTRYQTRSLKKVLVDASYIDFGVSDYKILAQGAEYTVARFLDHDGGDTALLLEEPRLRGLPYGLNNIGLSLIDGIENQSVVELMIFDFNIFSTTTTTFARGYAESGGLMGGFGQSGSTQHSSGTSLSSGFQTIVNH